MRPQGRTVEQELARLATATHGVVRRADLVAAGITAAEIKARVASGALLRERRGVYRVGHRAPSVEARYLAAVWACGEGALLCGRAAAFLLGLLPGAAAPPPEVVARGERRSEGVRVKRSRGLDGRDAAMWRGVPLTLSALERRFLRLLRDSGLPLPETNRLVDGRRIDCRWPEHRLTVELDGYRYHRSRHAWEQDRRREREARARGDDFRRYTFADVGQPRAILVELQSGLSGPVVA